MATDRSQFVHKDVTVVIGHDDDPPVTVVFLVMKGRSMAISFPRFQGGATEIPADKMGEFFEKTPPSEMLDAIKDAWWEKQAQ